MSQKGFSSIGYYLKVWVATFKYSLSKAGTYKVEVIARAMRGVFLVFIQIIFINAVVGKASNFAGWSLDEMYLLAGIFNSINYISWSLFSINLWRLEEKVMKGEFDFLLLKPMSSIFAASFTEFFVDDAVSGISGLILIAYYFVKHSSEIQLVGIVGCLITVVSAFLIWFSMELIFASFDFVRIKNGLREIKKQIVGIGKFPTDIWNGNLKLMFYTVVPIAFVATVPARVLNGVYNWKYVLASLFISILFVIIARKIWYINLKKYTSASS